MLSFLKTPAGAILLGLVLVVGLLTLQNAVAQTSSDQTGKQLHLELSEGFYRALKAETRKSYSTDQSSQYLRHIAISSRYTVETNLHIIKQNERIISLLEGRPARPPKSKP